MKIVVEDVVSNYSDMVLQIAYHKTFNMSDAEDITQEVFIKLMNNLDKIESEEHLKSWLIRVAVNLSIDFKKSFWSKKVGEIDENMASSASNEDFEKADELNEYSDVTKEINNLKPPIYREIIYLYFYKEYKIKEIADILNLSINTVSSALTRAKKKLKVSLEGVEIYE